MTGLTSSPAWDACASTPARTDCVSSSSGGRSNQSYVAGGIHRSITAAAPWLLGWTLTARSVKERGQDVVIPLVDVTWQNAQVRAEIDRALEQILTDTGGDGASFVASLERDFAARLGRRTGRRCSVRSRGRVPDPDSAGDRPGRRGHYGPNSDIATTAAISQTGARFVLVDVEPRTHNMDLIGSRWR